MKKITRKLIKFRDKRNWQQFHSGFALSHKLQIESAEVAELFEWGQEPDCEGQDPDLEMLEEELADVMIIALYICEKYGIDPKKAIKSKIKKNASKYPSDYKNANWRAK